MVPPPTMTPPKPPPCFASSNVLQTYRPRMSCVKLVSSVARAIGETSRTATHRKYLSSYLTSRGWVPTPPVPRNRLARTGHEVDTAGACARAKHGNTGGTAAVAGTTNLASDRFALGAVPPRTLLNSRQACPAFSFRSHWRRGARAAG